MTFQPGKSGNPQGRKKEQAFRNALTLALGDGKDPRAKLRPIAEKLVQEALKGEQWAIKEVADRMDGKPVQAMEHSGEDGQPLSALVNVTLSSKPGTSSETG